MFKARILTTITAAGILAACVTGPLAASAALDYWGAESEETAVSEINLEDRHPADIGSAVINAVMLVWVIIAVSQIIVSGFNLHLAGGNEDAAKSAKSSIINAFMGLVITLLVFGLISFLLQAWKNASF
jgi:uncharacterized protein YacL